MSGPRAWVYSPRPSQGIPVAVALAALTLAVLLAVELSGGSKRRSLRAGASVVAAAKRSPGLPSAGAPVSGAAPVAASAVASIGALTVPVAVPDHRAPLGLGLGVSQPVAHTARYSGGSYSLAYPVGWSVAKSNQPIANYAETMLESRDAAAKITIDHTAGEITDPAAKAAQVESATSRTPGYHRVAFRSLTLGGRSAVEWVFTLAGASAPQRTDIFLNTGHDGFAFLAYGASYARAIAAARAAAASVDVKG